MSPKSPKSLHFSRLSLFRLLSIIIMLVSVVLVGYMHFDGSDSDASSSADIHPSPSQPSSETSPAPTQSAAASPSAEPTAAPVETASPSAEPSAAPTRTPSPTATPRPTATPAPTATPQQTSAPTPSPAPVPTPSPEPLLPERAHSGVFQNGLGGPVSYSWGDSVPESDPVADSWFSDAAFIGNSLCDGLSLYGNLKGTTFFAAQSVTVSTILTNECINSGSGYIPITDALAKKQYKKVFIMLGINEIYLSSSWFYSKYSTLIDSIRELEPGAEIYVQSILPVTEEKSNSGGSITKANVDAFNASLKQLSSAKSVFYLDVNSALADENGYLPVDGSTDGVHLNRAYYEKWSDYLRVHSITEVSDEA